MTSEFTLAEYGPEDFPLIDGWWRARGRPSPNPNFLPPTGVIVIHEKQPVAAGFLFKTDARIAIINHVVSSPVRMDRKVRGQAITFLISHLLHLANREGFKLVTSASNVERLNERYQAMGFEKTDSNETHFGRFL